VCKIVVDLLSTCVKLRLHFNTTGAKTMAQTYAQAIADVRADLMSEGYEADICIYMDIAESLLEDKSFRRLAEAKFPGRDTMSLKECVAHSI
jgi:hypothetical protein